MPSVIIINTCTVTSKADQKARRVIRKALRDYPDACIVVTGCYAQLDKDDILKLDTANSQRLFVIKKDEILNFIKNGSLDKNNPNLCESVPVRGQFQFNPKRFSEHTRCLLKIQDGCDNHCTYCKIRLARGKSISLEPDEVLSRLRILEKSYAETVLTGVNISQYKSINNEQVKYNNLAALLECLLLGTERITIRLSSLAPDCVDEQLAKVLSHKRIRPHFHLSVQSCSKTVLEKMGRTYNAQTVKDAVKLLRDVKDDPFLACDIITGFPGETETEFNETLNICAELDFAWIHVFPYSKRKGTPAYSFTDNIAEIEITNRVQQITSLAKQGRASYVKRWLGREVDVLMEKNGYGTTENYLKAYVRCNEQMPSPGTALYCRLLEPDNPGDYDVIAALVRRV